MEPAIPTSFIPKRPIDPGAPLSEKKSKESFGLLSLLIFIIIAGTAASYALTYFYQGSLERQKISLEESLRVARDGIGTDFVTDMKRLDERIRGVKSLLASHIVVSPIFEALEATTLHSIQYKSFEYQFENNSTAGSQSVIVSLEGTTKSYATLALQSDAFLGSSIIKNPVFSELTVDDKTRNVNFKLSFMVDAAALSYETFINVKNAQMPTSTNLLPQ